MNQLVITGGCGGLGQAIIETFTCPEWNISAPGHSELDVTDPAAIHRFFESRPVDLLVCAAGITRDAPLLGMEERAWDEVFAVNYRGAANCAKMALPRMVARGIGHIIFMSSYSAIHPPAGQVAYATAKAALLGLTRSLARSHGAHGIRVNAILPGFLETEMTRSVSENRKRRSLVPTSLVVSIPPLPLPGFSAIFMTDCLTRRARSSS